MITRLYVDNYKTLSNFEWKPEAVELLAGRNGSGKSSVFEIVAKLVDMLVQGKKVSDIFHPDQFTRWSSKPLVTIEIDVKNGTAAFRYRVCLARNVERGFVYIDSETLTLDGASVLMSYAGRKLTLCSPEAGTFGAFDFGSSRSFVAEIQKTQNTVWHLAFREALDRIGVFSPNPVAIRSRSESEQPRLAHDCGNLVDWYRYWIGTYPERGIVANKTIAASLPGFKRLALPRFGTQVELHLEFAHSVGAAELRFDELSDGQRMIVTLALIFASRAYWVVLLDEPDNYVGPAEIHSVLNVAGEYTSDDALPGNQLAVISHHPESIDFFASHSACLFHSDNGLTRITSLREIDLEGLRLSMSMIDGVV